MNRESELVLHFLPPPKPKVNPNVDKDWKRIDSIEKVNSNYYYYCFYYFHSYYYYYLRYYYIL